jgi:hypothetical protein
MQTYRPVDSRMMKMNLLIRSTGPEIKEQILFRRTGLNDYADIRLHPYL